MWQKKIKINVHYILVNVYWKLILKNPRFETFGDNITQFQANYDIHVLRGVSDFLDDFFPRQRWLACQY